SSIATVDAANGNREALFSLQQEFFTVNNKGAKSYLIGDNYDISRLNKFIKLLLTHRLEVYENNQNVTLNGITYEKGKSYIIPIAQPNSALVQIIFDDKKDYPNVSQLGYGAGFSVAYSTGLSYAQVLSPVRGAKVEAVPEVAISSLQKSNYAYLIDYRDSKSQRLLFKLLEKDILVKSAFRPFSINTAAGVKDFTYGTLLIPVSNQSVSSDELFALLKELGNKEQVTIIPITTGYSIKGVDLGSDSFRKINKPGVLVVTGGDVSSTEAGEVWHLFDKKLSYPVIRVDYTSFSRVPLKDFNRIIFVSGNYSFLNATALQSLKNWIENGGTLITLNSATQWAISAKLLTRGNATAEKATDNVISPVSRGRQPTSIFETRINLEHPIAFGLTNEILPVSRENTSLLPSDSLNTVSRYTNTPLLNGYIESANRIKGTASIRIGSQGSGSIILFAEDPLFRGIWDATERTFVNAVLLGDKTNAARFRY
ncbi:MAG: hypothetical protein LBV64_01145, partial [Mediterranea sp.]|nr:hypothetical protein [Mediterranea sp.]